MLKSNFIASNWKFLYVGKNIYIIYFLFENRIQKKQ